MKHRTMLTAALLVLGVAPKVVADTPGRELETLVGKMHGAWKGQGPCNGDLTLRANGTYERRLHGPSGNNSAGTWKVRWDALPPTLILTCTTSDDPAYIGQTRAVKLVQLDDTDLVFQYQDLTPSRFTREKQKPQDAQRGKGGEGISRDELLGTWRSAEITLTGGQSDLDLKPDGKFVYEHLDVSLGWRTTLLGTWELKGNRLVLTAQQRRDDGKDVEVGEKKTEELSATRRGKAWFLRGARGSELRKTAKDK